MNTSPTHYVLNANQVAIWLCDLSKTQATESILNMEELTRYQAMHAIKADYYLASRHFLRDMLGRYLAKPAAEVGIQIGQGGKPHLTDHALEFNLSHSDHWAVLAIAHQAVGIDIEKVREHKNMAAIAQRVFPDTYQKQLAQSQNNPQLFTELWTLFEAQQKCIGSGVFAEAANENTIQTQHFDAPEDFNACMALKTSRPFTLTQHHYQP